MPSRPQASADRGARRTTARAASIVAFTAGSASARSPAGGSGGAVRILCHKARIPPAVSNIRTRPTSASHRARLNRPARGLFPVVPIGSLPLPGALALQQLHHLIRPPAVEGLPGAVRPEHLEGVHLVRRPQPEVGTGVVAAQEAL